MKKACLCAVAGSGMLFVCPFFDYVRRFGAWDSNTLDAIHTIWNICYILGWGLMFYFFSTLYKKQ